MEEKELSPEEKQELRWDKTIQKVILWIVGIAIAGLVILIVTIPNNGGTTAPQAAQPLIAAPPPASPAPTDSSDNAQQTDAATPVQPKPKSFNCYDNPGPSILFHETPETRRQFAAGANTDDSIYVSVGGNDNQYLLFTAVPENENSLRELAAGMMSDESGRSNLCIKGFAEAQFIVHDANMNQRLVGKIETDYRQAANYLQQHYMTKPMN